MRRCSTWPIPPPLTQRVLPDFAEPRVSYVVARLERAVRQGINERVRPYGLTTLQYTTLSVLGRRRDGLSNAQLARRSFMTPQAMGEVIEALEAAGFIKRNRHPNHRRVFPATLTPKGRRALATCEEAVCGDGGGDDARLERERTSDAGRGNEELRPRPPRRPPATLEARRCRGEDVMPPPRTDRR